MSAVVRVCVVHSQMTLGALHIFQILRNTLILSSSPKVTMEMI